MSTSDASAITRLCELYRIDGLREVRRGIRDELILTTGLPFHRLYETIGLPIAGHRVTLNVWDNESVIRAGGHGEVGVLKDFIGEVDGHTIVWDVGANVGLYTLFAATAGADVCAFEPGGETRRRLQANIEENGVGELVRELEVALSDSEGTATLAQTERLGVRSITDGDGETIRTARGDSLDNIPDPDVVKIDVEGHELAVLDGMRHRLGGVRVAYVEVHLAHDVSNDAVDERLRDAGLTPAAQWRVGGGNPILKYTRSGSE